MADEPNKRMDDMLRAYAEKRRKSPETPLHPATRKLLQSEVARTFPPASKARSWFDLLRPFWPQLAFGGSLCLILGIAVLSLRQPPPATDEKTLQQLPAPSAVQEQEQLASPSDLRTAPTGANSREPTRKLREQDSYNRDNASRPASIAIPQDNAGVVRPEPGLELREAGISRLADSASVAPAQDSAAKSPSIVLSRDATESKRAEKKEATPVPASNDPSPAPVALAITSPTSAPRAETILSAEVKTRGLVNEMTNLGAARRLHFVQQSAPLRSAPAPQSTATITNPVLNMFQVEQLGRNVRFLDRDGSVYLGELAPQDASLSFAAASVQTKDQPTNLSDTLANSAVFNFSLQGTNKTLGKGIAMTGLYFERTNTARSSIDTFSIAPQRPKPVQQQLANPSHLIIGNAVVDTTNQFQFRAVSVEQP